MFHRPNHSIGLWDRRRVAESETVVHYEAAIMSDTGAVGRVIIQELASLENSTSIWPLWRRRTLQRRQTVLWPARTRGQALVEFALVAPLFLLLLFGVVEYSLINSSIGAYNFAAKDAAREGAILGKSGAPGSTSTTPIDPDTYIVNNIILPRLTGLVIAQMSTIEIFHANQTGACVSTTASNGTSVCQEDVWSQSGGAWASTSNNWPSSQRNDQLANADYLGVRLTYTYTYLTALFAITSPTINLAATSVQRIEPQEYGQRAPQQVPALGAPPLWASVLPAWENQTSAVDQRRTHTAISGGRA